jgi:hypothetical protein
MTRSLTNSKTITMSKKIITVLSFLFLTNGIVFGQSLIDKTPDYRSPFEISIKSSVLSSSSLFNIQLKEDTDSVRFELFNGDGETQELLFEGSMLSGEHQFNFIPLAGISRPFIAVLSIATKVVSMRVVKFNSF